MEIVKGKIANAITSAAEEHIVATTDDLFDTSVNKYQEEINRELYEKSDFDTATDEDIDNIIDSLTI